MLTYHIQITCTCYRASYLKYYFISCYCSKVRLDHSGWFVSYNYDFHILPISEQMLLPLDVLCFFSADHNSRTGPSKPRSSTSLLCGPSGSPKAHGLSSVYGHTNTMVTVLTDLGHRTRYLGYNGNLDWNKLHNMYDNNCRTQWSTCDLCKTVDHCL